MDLIYTDAERVDQGVLSAYSLDLSFGADENNFELTIGTKEAALDFGSFIYIEGTEYGGIVDSKKTNSDSESITYKGRTWHGILNSKVLEPPEGEDYLSYSIDWDANTAILLTLTSAKLKAMTGAVDLFKSSSEKSTVVVKETYKFHRYCKCYDGIVDMLSEHGAKLKIEWKDRQVVLSAVPIVDYTATPVDGDEAGLSVEQHKNKVNHLICLGAGNLAEREVIHLYADESGNIVDTQYFKFLDDVTEVYDNSNSEDLRSDGIKKLKELRNSDKAEISLPDEDEPTYDIGDIVGATDLHSGVSASAAVTQKIVRINNGVVSTEYKTGR